ncbi:MAG: putative PEP-binding protein [Bdellovibrionales bacterium]
MTDFSLLSPDDAAELLLGGHSPLEVFAHLDVEALRYAPHAKACDGGGPLAETGQTGYGNAASGRLAFSRHDVLEIQAQGDAAFLVVLPVSGRAYTSSARLDGVIAAYRQVGKPVLEVHEHDALALAEEKLAWFDDRVNSRLIVDARAKTLVVLPDSGDCEPATLRKGDVVTLDPLSGQIWIGACVIVPVSPSVRVIRKYFSDLQKTLGQSLPDVAFHANQASDLQLLYTHQHIRNVRERKSSRDWLDQYPGEEYAIGLRRSEPEMQEIMLRNGNALKELARGVVPGCVKERLGGMDSGFGRTKSVTYRLLDLKAMFDAAGLEVSRDRRLAVQDELYAHQVRNALRGHGTRWMEEIPPILIVPHIDNFEEAKRFKTVVTQAAQSCEGGRHVRFGAMIETPGALENVRKIAGICDGVLCIGSNDLTAYLTGISRKGEDRTWYRQMHPDVIHALGQRIPDVRKDFPEMAISVCGEQVSGSPESISSIESMLKIGVNRVTVVPNPDRVFRAHMAIIRHFARH